MLLIISHSAQFVLVTRCGKKINMVVPVPIVFQAEGRILIHYNRTYSVVHCICIYMVHVMAVYVSLDPLSRSATLECLTNDITSVFVCILAVLMFYSFIRS